MKVRVDIEYYGSLEGFRPFNWQSPSELMLLMWDRYKREDTLDNYTIEQLEEDFGCSVEWVSNSGDPLLIPDIEEFRQMTFAKIKEIE